MFQDNYIPLHDNETMVYKWQIMNAIAFQKAHYPVELPNPRLTVGLYNEYMGNVPVTYNGRAGKFGEYDGSGIKESIYEVSPKFEDPIKPLVKINTPTGYVGEAIVGV